MKRSMKKLTALLLAMVMVLAMSVTAFAATQATAGNLKVNVMDGGSLLNQRIYLFKLMSLTSTDPAAYSANENYENILKDLLDVTSTDAQADYDIYSALAAKEDTELKGFANQFTNRVIANGSVAGNENIDYKISGTITDAKSYTFEDVDPGYYLVYLGGSVSIQSSLVTVNGADNSSDQQYDEVDLKAATPTPEKTANEETVTIGDIITYTVKFQIPDITGYKTEGYKFNLVDELSAGLDFVKDSGSGSYEIVGAGADLPVKVKIGDDGQAKDMNATTDPSNKRKMTLNLGEFIVENQDSKGKTVEVTYFAQVNENAKIDNTSNNAKLEYTNDPTTGSDGESVTDKVETPTFDIKIRKYEKGQADDTYLGGAVFNLYKDDNGNPGTTTVKMNAESNSGQYTVAKDQTSAIVEDLKTADNEISGIKANLQIYGLEEGTYYLVEKTAPETFNKMAEKIKIVIQDTSTEGNPSYSITAETINNEGTKVDDLTASGNVVAVMNSRGTLLPGTGGMGTMIFTAVGVILILGVGASFVVSRRRNEA